MLSVDSEYEVIYYILMRSDGFIFEHQTAGYVFLLMYKE